MPTTTTHAVPPAFNGLIESQRRMGQMWLNHTQRMTDLQLDATRRCSEIGVRECRSMLSVRDGASLQRFLGEQGELFREFGDTMNDLMRRYSELGNSFTEEMGQLSRESAERGQSAGEEAVASFQESASEAASSGARQRGGKSSSASS